MLENVRKNAPDFYHAWRKYCAVKNWRDAEAFMARRLGLR